MTELWILALKFLFYFYCWQNAVKNDLIPPDLPLLGALNDNKKKLFLGFLKVRWSVKKHNFDILLVLTLVCAKKGEKCKRLGLRNISLCGSELSVVILKLVINDER